MNHKKLFIGITLLAFVAFGFHTFKKMQTEADQRRIEEAEARASGYELLTKKEEKALNAYYKQEITKEVATGICVYQKTVHTPKQDIALVNQFCECLTSRTSLDAMIQANQVEKDKGVIPMNRRGIVNATSEHYDQCWLKVYK